MSAVVALAGSLGLGVVAEGVELQDQSDLLVALGVHAAQGWLWGAAVPSDRAAWALPPTVPSAREDLDVPAVHR